MLLQGRSVWISLSKLGDHSRHQSQNRSRMETVSACIANWLPVSHGCMNTLTRQQQTGTLCGGLSKQRRWWFQLKSAHGYFKALNGFGIPIPKDNLETDRISTSGAPRDNCTVWLPGTAQILFLCFHQQNIYTLKSVTEHIYRPFESASLLCRCESRPWTSETVKEEWCNQRPICVCCFLPGALQHSATDNSSWQALEFRFH